LILASLAPALWGIIELGILLGTRGPNLVRRRPGATADLKTASLGDLLGSTILLSENLLKRRWLSERLES
jgi:hypothetical protein